MISKERLAAWTPEKQRECQRRYRENNPDRVRESNLRYKRLHREEAREKYAAYRASHRTAILEKRRRDYYEHPEKTAISDRKWREKNPEKCAARVARWQKANHEKRRVHAFVCRQVRLGRIIRPKTCSQCGLGGRIEGHHEDYSKPLEIIWLCQKCHSALRRKFRAALGLKAKMEGRGK